MIKPIKTNKEYQVALRKLESVFDAKPNTANGDILQILSLVIHDYEQKKYPILPLTPVEALKYEMEEQGFSQSALAKKMKISKSTISEILRGKKQMSLKFIKYLHKDLGIPADILLSI
ncbi:MAG: helix-turn-helix domain-containing protein [Saprospiraceae bacterium]